MSPSVSAKRSFGNRCQKSAQSRSPRVKMLIADDRFIGTGGGASGAVDALFDEDPTWQHSTVPVSAHAANNGSHASVWMLGMPRPAGFSENVTAWQPLPASRVTSSAASSTSNNGKIPHGMKRSGYAPHHSSTCQSF